MAITERLQQIYTQFRNIALNTMGVKRDLYTLLQDGDVNRALMLMENHDVDVDAALKEYNNENHSVNYRPNKSRKNDDQYITEKLPRNRCRYINEVESFFLIPGKVKWELEEGSEQAFRLFTDFVSEVEFDSNLQKAKALAGSETESALLFHIYQQEREDGSKEADVRLTVLARSTGFRLRPLIDQYGQMVAFAYGYTLLEGGRNVQHWDFQTAEKLVYTSRRGPQAGGGWDVKIYDNPTGKINILYFNQETAWSGMFKRINREEYVDSKTADTNNYFADPIAAASADVINSMAKPESVGRLIQLTGKDSRFGYVNPPTDSATLAQEKVALASSILFDTLTPDLSFENLKGIGTMSGAAIRNSLIIGMIKRRKNLIVYGSLLKKCTNVMKAIVAYRNPALAKAVQDMKVRGEFPLPFEDDPLGTNGEPAPEGAEDTPNPTETNAG